MTRLRSIRVQGLHSSDWVFALMESLSIEENYEHSEVTTLNGIGNPTMKSTVVLASITLALSAGIGAAQQSSFDSKTFFDELQTRGVSVSANFDSKTFFDDLSTKGVSASKPLDAKEFFDELSARGVSVPGNFDRQKFFSELQAKGVAAPPMVAPK